MFKQWKKINLPTKITLVRIAMLPVIMFFYIAAVTIEGPFFTNWGKLVALILFVIAAATDWLDGYIARRCNLVTNTGKLLDPVADKMLTMLGFILVLSDPIFFINYDGDFIMAATFAFPYWFAVLAVFVALGRDIIMNSLRFIAAEQGITIAADKLGKLKTIFQLIALSMYMLLAFMLNPYLELTFVLENTIWFQLYAYISVFILATATVLSVWSCTNYIMSYVQSVSGKDTDKPTDEVKSLTAPNTPLLNEGEEPAKKPKVSGTNVKKEKTQDGQKRKK